MVIIVIVRQAYHCGTLPSRHLLLQGLLKCIGGAILAGIMRRIAEHHRYVTGGFPDLTVWNPDTGKFKAGTHVIAITI